MTRAVSNVPRHQRKRRLIKATRGYYGGRGRLYRSMMETYKLAGVDAQRGRKQKKRDYRALWITRISAALRNAGTNYSRFMYALRQQKIELNRQSLSELAIQYPKAFEKLVQLAQPVSAG